MLRHTFAIRAAWLPGAVVSLLRHVHFLPVSAIRSSNRVFRCFDVSMFRSHRRNVSTLGSMYHDTVIEVYCDIAIPSRTVLPTVLLNGMVWQFGDGDGVQSSTAEFHSLALLILDFGIVSIVHVHSSHQVPSVAMRVVSCHLRRRIVVRVAEQNQELRRALKEGERSGCTLFVYDASILLLGEVPPGSAVSVNVQPLIQALSGRVHSLRRGAQVELL